MAGMMRPLTVEELTKILSKKDANERIGYLFSNVPLGGPEHQVLVFDEPVDPMGGRNRRSRDNETT